MAEKQIFLLGDSLIAFFDWQSRFPTEKVFNLGVSGETVEGLLARVERGFSPYGEPDLVFFMSGINNVAGGDMAILETYDALIRRTKTIYPRARIFVHSLLPTLLEWIEKNAIERINDRLEKLAQAEGISFIDIHRLFLDREGRVQADYLLPDGVHLSPVGYRVWADALEKIIAPSRGL